MLVCYKSLDLSHLDSAYGLGLWCQEAEKVSSTCGGRAFEVKEKQLRDYCS